MYMQVIDIRVSRLRFCWVENGRTFWNMLTKVLKYRIKHKMEVPYRYASILLNRDESIKGSFVLGRCDITLYGGHIFLLSKCLFLLSKCPFNTIFYTPTHSVRWPGCWVRCFPYENVRVWCPLNTRAQSPCALICRYGFGYCPMRD